MPLWEIFWNASGTLGGKEIREGEIGGGGEGTRGKELLSERIVNEAPSPPPPSNACDLVPLLEN